MVSEKFTGEVILPVLLLGPLFGGFGSVIIMHPPYRALAAGLYSRSAAKGCSVVRFVSPATLSPRRARLIYHADRTKEKVIYGEGLQDSRGGRRPDFSED
jgi:hypothetical protein